MKRIQENSIWNELWTSIKFYKESKNGKYSLDTYLDIMEKYTDRQIVEAEENGLTYLGGECKIINSYDTNTYDFEVYMYFLDSKGKRIEKEAKRKLSKNKFVSETDCKVGEKIRFEIQKPS